MHFNPGNSQQISIKFGIGGWMVSKTDKEVQEDKNFKVSCWQRYVQTDEGNKQLS